MAVCLLFVQIALADLAVSRERASLRLRLRYTKALRAGTALAADAIHNLADHRVASLS